jgi:plastocyanin
MLSRRQVLEAGGGALAGLLLPSLVRAAPAAEVVEIRMRGNADGSKVWYDPVGVLIQPGQTIRWISADPVNSHTATAYHPKNFDHSLRIPEKAEPWNSDYLLPNETFEVKLTIEGVYDFFCIPHEQAGMVGRIIVGRPIGPGAQPFDYFRNSTKGRDWVPVPKEARGVFPSVDEIMRQKSVRHTETPA